MGGLYPARPMRALSLVVMAVVALLVAAACGGSSQSSLPQGSEPANLDSADFASRIDNPYWPMAPGSRWVYREGDQRTVVAVTDKSKRILGIPATVVHDVVTEDGALVEDTWDWYAQDKEGNIWYLGEATKEFENGKVKSTEGSWEAGVEGAEAGIIVPAKPKVGMTYRQEYLKGEAEDAADVLSVDKRATVPYGSFDELLETKDYTPLEPKLVENKYYAKGVGPVLGITVSGGSDRETLLSFVHGS
jgi:hypothetical protein